MNYKSNKKRDNLVEPEVTSDTILTSGISLGVDTDITDPSGKDYISGESVNEHRIVEQANEYIAEEEIKQQFIKRSIRLLYFYLKFFENLKTLYKNCSLCDNIENSTDFVKHCHHRFYGFFRKIKFI